MLRSGTRVKIIGLPPDNQKTWGIPQKFIGKEAIVIESHKYNVLSLIDVYAEVWNFPLEYKGILEPIIQNKWNPMNYIPRFVPLKLP